MTSSGMEPATFRLVAAVPQPTAPPRAPLQMANLREINTETFNDVDKSVPHARLINTEFLALHEIADTWISAAAEREDVLF